MHLLDIQISILSAYFCRKIMYVQFFHKLQKFATLHKFLLHTIKNTPFKKQMPQAGIAGDDMLYSLVRGLTYSSSKNCSKWLKFHIRCQHVCETYMLQVGFIRFAFFFCIISMILFSLVLHRAKMKEEFVLHLIKEHPMF